MSHTNPLFRTCLALLLAFALGAGKATSTQPTTAPIDAAAVDAVIRPLVELEYCQCVVVGVVDADGPRVYAYGRVSSDDPRAPDGNTLFEIGSVTKVFTSLLLADMSRKGMVSLDDPITKHLPASVKPSKELIERNATLADLASHRSGLPRMPGNFAPTNLDDPYADYTAEKMYDALSRVRPTPASKDAPAEYSNLGAGLLGHILGLRHGKGYDSAITEHVLRPLGMNDSAIELSEEQKRRFAPGHDPDGNRVSAWNLAEPIAGAGAIRSSASDLLKFVAAQIDAPQGSGLADAIRDTHVSRGTMGGPISVGLGWMIAGKYGYLWHNGQTGGYHSFIAVHRERKVGLVILSNTATGAIDPAGAVLIRRMIGEPMEMPVTLRKAIQLDPKLLDRYVGEFTMVAANLSITRGPGGVLLAQLTGQPAFRIYPESETTFFWKVVDAHVVFDIDPEGKVPRLTLHQSGRKIPMARLASTRPATAPATVPSKEDRP
jgi:CubicO group peptidase (beta-lactamase class C family)